MYIIIIIIELSSLLLRLNILLDIHTLGHQFNLYNFNCDRCWYFLDITCLNQNTVEVFSKFPVQVTLNKQNTVEVFSKFPVLVTLKSPSFHSVETDLKFYNFIVHIRPTA